MSDSDHIYSPLHPAARFMIETRLRECRRFFARIPRRMDEIKLLEVGNGDGQWLTEFQTFGLLADNMAGVDLDASRIEGARRRLPSADLRVGDAERLPWKDGSFDVVFQSTLFSSVLDPDKRRRIAAEMKRVCDVDGGVGLILWYDFVYDNPRNDKVRGVSAREVAELFFPWTCDATSVTLAPPLTRAIVPYSRMACEMLEWMFPFLRTHLVAVMSPR